MINNHLVGGWATYPSEKWWSEFVSWDDEIPNIWKWKVIKFMFQTTNQQITMFHIFFQDKSE